MASVGIPGKVYRDDWVSFGHNRTLAMQRARGTTDYHLLLDADMVLRVQSSEGRMENESLTGENRRKQRLGNLKEDAYLLRFEGACDYSVIRLVSDQHEWRYIGATHEYVHSDTAKLPVKLPGVSVVHYEDGGSRSDKYERDIRLLTAEYEGLAQQKQTKEAKKEGNLERTVFYLAQSYRDSKQFESALDWYERRALMGGWAEETWNALYQLGRIQQALGHDWRVVLNSYLQAFNFRPWRLEAPYQIARFYREHQQWELGYHFARLVTEYGYPEDILFVERSVYEYLLAFEYAVCCFHTDRKDETLRVAEILASQGRIPVDLLQMLPTRESSPEVSPAEQFGGGIRAIASVEQATE
jgi:tetratricopeptide (TPR) repeat protein